MVSKRQAKWIRLGITDARKRVRNYYRSPTGVVVPINNGLYQLAYKTTQAKMPPPRPPRGPSGIYTRPSRGKLTARVD